MFVAAHLIRHRTVDLINSEKLIKCNLCNTGFARKCNLKRHMLKKHKISEFEIVGVGVPESTCVPNHIPESTFKCVVCGKEFKSRKAMTTHRKTHTKEKKFECTICGKAFTQKRYVKAHEKTHSGKVCFLSCTS